MHLKRSVGAHLSMEATPLIKEGGGRGEAMCLSMKAITPSIKGGKRRGEVLIYLAVNTSSLGHPVSPIKKGQEGKWGQ